MYIKECIISGIFLLVFAIPSFILIIKAEDWSLILALVLLIQAILPGWLFFDSLSVLVAPPVVTSCVPIDVQGVTLYEFCDSTRYCAYHIEEHSMQPLSIFAASLSLPL